MKHEGYLETETMEEEEEEEGAAIIFSQIKLHPKSNSININSELMDRKNEPNWHIK